MAVRPDLSPPARPRWGWLLVSFTRREVLNRYAGSITGLAWTLLHPLAQLAIFAFVFSQIFRVTVPAEFPGATYTTFVAVALWPWIMFSEGLQRAMGSVAANAGLIRKVAFPHRLLVYPGAVPPFHYWAPDESGRCLWYPSLTIVTGPRLRSWDALLERASELLHGHAP